MSASAEVRRVVADVHPGAEGPQREQGRGVAPVAAGHPDAPGQQDPGDAAHPGPADADEVHGTQLGQRRDRIGPGGHVRGTHRATDSTMSANRSSASVAPRGRRVLGVAGQRGGVGEQRHEPGLDPRRAQLGVLHEQATPGLDHGQRVAPLLPVADGQRDERGGQPDGGQLRDGHRAGPAQGEVGGGVGEVHALQIVNDHVGGTTRGAGRNRDGGVLRPAGVQDLDARGGERVGRGHGGQVERPGTLRAAEDEQGGPVGVEPELGAGRSPVRRPVQGADRRPQGHAHVLALVQRRAGHGDRHPGGEPGTDPVGQAGQRVLLVHHDRDTGAPGGEVRRQGHVPAEPDDDVRGDLVEHGTGVGDRPPYPAGHAEQVEGRLARQRHRRDQAQVVAAGRYEAGLHAAGGAQAGDPQRRSRVGRAGAARRRGPASARCAPRYRLRPGRR